MSIFYLYSPKSGNLQQNPKSSFSPVVSKILFWDLVLFWFKTFFSDKFWTVPWRQLLSIQAHSSQCENPWAPLCAAFIDQSLPLESQPWGNHCSDFLSFPRIFQIYIFSVLHDIPIWNRIFYINLWKNSIV